MIEQKREGPDIRFVSNPVKIDPSIMNETGFSQEASLLFQNIGARAGSLIGVRLEGLPEVESGFIKAIAGSIPPTMHLPKIVRPYTAILVPALVSCKGIPNVKTLIATLGDRVQITVTYSVSTKAKKPVEVRTGYFMLIFG